MAHRALYWLYKVSSFGSAILETSAMLPKVSAPIFILLDHRAKERSSREISEQRLAVAGGDGCALDDTLSQTSLEPSVAAGGRTKDPLSTHTISRAVEVFSSSSLKSSAITLGYLPSDFVDLSAAIPPRSNCLKYFKQLQGQLLLMLLFR